MNPNLEHVALMLSDAIERLAKMDAALQEQLAKVDRIANDEAERLTKELRILECNIRDAERRRRWRIVESLSPKYDEMFASRHQLCVERDRAKQKIQYAHDDATYEIRALRDRLMKTLNDAAAMERQRELQIRRHRKIPVMR